MTRMFAQRCFPEMLPTMTGAGEYGDKVDTALWLRNEPFSDCDAVHHSPLVDVCSPQRNLCAVGDASRVVMQ